MPSKPARPCTTCGQRATQGGKCERHAQQQRQRTDQRRGTNTARGYGQEHRERFRPGVLNKDDWTCQLCGDHATVADHYPLSRKELLAQGMDANDPKHGRGLCAGCHSTHTMTTEGQGKNNLRR